MQAENADGARKQNQKAPLLDIDANDDSAHQDDEGPEALGHLQPLTTDSPGSDPYRTDSIPRTNAGEEAILWRKYHRWRRLQRLPGSRIVPKDTPRGRPVILHGCNLRCVLSRIIEEICNSHDLLVSLRHQAGLDRLDDMTEGAEADPSAAEVLYLLTQRLRTKYSGKIEQGDNDSVRLCLGDLLGFMLGRTLNDIAYRRGSPDLVDRTADAINLEPTYVRGRLSELAVDIDLLPRSLLSLFDARTPVRELCKLVESISAESFHNFVLNDCLPFISNIRSEGEGALARIVESHLWLAVDVAKQYYTENAGASLDDMVQESSPSFSEVVEDEVLHSRATALMGTRSVGWIDAVENKDLSLPLDDLIQEAIIGLIIAAEKFQPNQGIRYMSYAGYWVFQRVYRAMADQARIIRVPAHTIERISSLLSVSSQLVQELGREPDPEEIGDRMGLPPEKVVRALSVAELPVSLYTPLGDDEASSLGDFLEDETFASPFDAVASKLLKEHIDRVLTTLKPKEQEVIEFRFGLRGRHARTLEEVGREFNVTRERIRQIEASALKRLRHPTRSRWLRGYL